MNDTRNNDSVSKDDENGAPKSGGGMNTMAIVPKKSIIPLVIGGVLLVLATAVLAIQLKSTRTELAAAESKSEKSGSELAAAQKELHSRVEAFETERSDCQSAKTALEEQVAGLESAVESTRSQIGALKDETEEANRELAQLKAFSTKFQRMINAGKLEVVFRRGRMVLNLPAKVLFDSGSADLSEEGRAAVKEVAGILRTVQGKRFVVAGHTDDQKIKRSSFKSNWELSSARALSVTEMLIKGGVKPGTLSAAGFGQFSPIASNKTEPGRQQNRRIEIILEPNLQGIKPLPKKGKPAKKK